MTPGVDAILTLVVLVGGFVYGWVAWGSWPTSAHDRRVRERLAHIRAASPTQVGCVSLSTHKEDM